MKRSPLVALTAAVCCLAVPVAASAATTSVVAGPPIKRAPAGVPKDGDLNQFFPSAVKIHVGDKVSWTVAGFHVVQFPKAGSAPPQLAVPDPSRPATGFNDAAGQAFWFNGQGTPVVPQAVALGLPGRTYDGSAPAGSGIPDGPPKPYVLKFTKAGTFTYYCTIHPGMKGTVKVVPKAKPAESAKAVKAAAAKQLATGLSTLKKLDRQQVAANTVEAGPDKGGAVLYRFTPGALTTKVGTPVTLQMTPGTSEDHTFTFAKDVRAAARISEKELLGPLGNANPPVFAFGPRWVYPSEAPGSTVSYDGTNHGDGFLNSGVLDGDSKTPFPQKFTVSFSKPGTYTFFCAIHPEMVGKITATS